jgi:hypothetical protein
MSEIVVKRRGSEVSDIVMFSTDMAGLNLGLY